MDPTHIRNFCLIAHIDHGKSTLADRLLEVTGTVPRRQMRDQVMDVMELERERGITIKAKAIRMVYRLAGETYQMNLIDTPGHVDFTYEVSRALAACEGAVLIVDASQGVEAQTLANAALAQEAQLRVIPVINKIDLPAADPTGVARQARDTLELTDPPLLVSAKEGTGVETVLKTVIERVPPPTGDPEAPLAGLIFDSWYDAYRGVFLTIKVLSGTARPGMRVRLMRSELSAQVEEVGFLQLKPVKVEQLTAGEVGYLVTGVKDIHRVRIGDTVTEEDRPTSHPHPGYRELTPMVYAGLYPMNSGAYEALQQALEKLHLTDVALVAVPESSGALGFGFRVGGLGLLHLEILKERLEREFGQQVLVTAPNVVYRVITSQGKTMTVESPAMFPTQGGVREIQEPFVAATVVTPSEFVGPLMQLCHDRRGIFQDMRYLTPVRVILRYHLPLGEIVSDFYDQLKSLSRGYASFDYEFLGYRPSDLVKLEVLVQNQVIEALCSVIHRERAYAQARWLVERLRELIPRQLFEVPIQARVGSRIIARETVRAIKKDVLAKCYGGDITRKRKLLEKQKEGKKRMKQFGQVEIPQEAFLAVLKREDPR
ncbi:MAG: elongation factor 4 [Elusimicrobia bacterium]|nr:elongation factor 4 [Elusimicrobiota bacterium]